MSILPSRCTGLATGEEVASLEYDIVHPAVLYAATTQGRVLVLLERAEPRPVVMQWFTMGGGLLNAGTNARARVHHQPRPLLPSSASGRLHGMLA